MPFSLFLPNLGRKTVGKDDRTRPCGFNSHWLSPHCHSRVSGPSLQATIRELALLLAKKQNHDRMQVAHRWGLCGGACRT